MSQTMLWLLFGVLFILSRLRLRQMAGTRDRVALLLFALGGAVIIAVGLLSWISAGLMLACWFILPVLVEPLIDRLSGSARPAAKKKGPPVDPSQRERMAKLNRGEMSLDDFFKEGREDDAESARRMEALAGRRDVAAVLSKYRISPTRFVALRDKLVQVPELQWEILGTPLELDRLIRMVDAKKNPAEIALAFRGRLAR